MVLWKSICKLIMKNMKIKFVLTVLFLIFVLRTSAITPVVPGIVINHIPKSTGRFIGSPSICILPNGDYVVSHDEFGPKSSEWQDAVTDIFLSSDQGETWKQISRIDGQFWSNLFYNDGALYIIGTNKHHGNFIIRRSTDNGRTWSVPFDAKHGLLLEGEYHTAPVPMVIHNGRIWRAVEYATGKSNNWGVRYSAMVVSAPVHSDLLNAKNWRATNHLPYNKTYLNGNFGGWLEGNTVLARNGRIVDVLRTHTPKLKNEYCAIVTISRNGKHACFKPDHFFEMPGASKKFTIRYDKKTDKYWSIVNYVSAKDRNVSNDRIRNTLALVSSVDLKIWKINKILIYHPDILYHAFQYVDWLFDKNDIIYVSRTAFDDEEGGSSSYHDSNFLTFHRIVDFRQTD